VYQDFFSAKGAKKAAAMIQKFALIEGELKCRNTEITEEIYRVLALQDLRLCVSAVKKAS
jgi:hypothetical protein